MKQIEIRIFKDGHIESETKGIKGRECLKYVSEVEKLTEAEVIDSAFTKDFVAGVKLRELESEYQREEVKING
ncbi:MAG: DUF2997 domain-containing protein [Firmicutes bacterium]|nr:DUF2997 domain-containing protein [Bacillota bacterium]